MRVVHSGNSNGVNGDTVRGCGLQHRKLTLKGRVALAADVVTGEKQFKPSQAQYCSIFGITVIALREELKRRAAANGNGNGNQVKWFVETWADLSYAGRAEVLRAIGVAEVWDVLANVVG